MVKINQPATLYERDFYAWTQEQAKLLKQKKWGCLDVPNLIEEIESLGRQERRELKNRLGILLGHLLKWEFQSSNRSRSWFLTIRQQRYQIGDLLEDNPSLKSYLSEALPKGYRDALSLAIRETSLSYKVFPQECPYTLEQILNLDFFPGQGFDIEAYL